MSRVQTWLIRSLPDTVSMGTTSFLARHWWDFGSILLVGIMFSLLKVPVYYTLLTITCILGIRVVVDLEANLRKDRPAKIGTYKDLVQANSYVTEDELKIIFAKDLDIYSNLWLLAIGVVIGVLGSPFSNLVQAELNIASTGVISATIGYTVVVVFAVYLLLRIAWYVAQNRNPFRIRDKLFKEYLEAKEELRARDTFLTQHTDAE